MYILIYQDMLDVYDRICLYICRMLVWILDYLNVLIGVQLFFKCENF